MDAGIPLWIWGPPLVNIQLAKAVGSGPVGTVWAGPTFGACWVWQYAIAILVDVVICYRPAPRADQAAERQKAVTSNLVEVQTQG